MLGTGVSSSDEATRSERADQARDDAVRIIVIPEEVQDGYKNQGDRLRHVESAQQF